MVFDSVARHYTAHGYGVSGGGGAATPLRPHVITTNMEHDSVSLMVKHMEEKGLIGEVWMDYLLVPWVLEQMELVEQVPTLTLWTQRRLLGCTSYLHWHDPAIG